MSHISIENVSVKFRSYSNCNQSLKEYFAGLLHPRKLQISQEFWALRDVSLQITAGDRVGIVGHNGAGKSTFLKALCRIYEPSQGQVHVDGRLAPLLEIGAGFHPDFTGRENIYLNGAILGYTQNQLRRIEPEVIEFAELEDFIDMPVKYYSTGMHLRLAFSLATAVEPDILILDEMFAGGDMSFVQRATDRMKQMIARANIMIFVSHDPSLLSTLCNRVIWLDHGKVKQDGPAKQVLSDFVGANARAA
ncbi:MAG: ABC transporter ATP-binding protein [Planctomycetia bacterium]|nr:ABC transporter ATP-binding protein [Planctomycetia bacterium]